MSGKVLNAHLQVIVNSISSRLYLSQTKMSDIWLDNENFIWQKFQETFYWKNYSCLTYEVKFWPKKRTKSFILARQGPIFFNWLRILRQTKILLYKNFVKDHIQQISKSWSFQKVFRGLPEKLFVLEIKNKILGKSTMTFVKKALPGTYFLKIHGTNRSFF